MEIKVKVFHFLFPLPPSPLFKVGRYILGAQQLDHSILKRGDGGFQFPILSGTNNFDPTLKSGGKGTLHFPAGKSRSGKTDKAL